MASEKQILANQRNAPKSCGPRTARGKAISSMNALKTGVFGKHVLLPDDNTDEFGRLRAALHDEWRPLGPRQSRGSHPMGHLFVSVEVFHLGHQLQSIARENKLWLAPNK